MNWKLGGNESNDNGFRKRWPACCLLLAATRLCDGCSYIRSYSAPHGIRPWPPPKAHERRHLSSRIGEFHTFEPCSSAVVISPGVRLVGALPIRLALPSFRPTPPPSPIFFFFFFFSLSPPSLSPWGHFRHISELRALNPERESEWRRRRRRHNFSPDRRTEEGKI